LKKVSTLQSLVLYSIPVAVLFDLLKMLWNLPMEHECQRALFRRCTLEELRDLAKTLPWDHPIARKLDHEVHRRRMAGESFCFIFSMARAWVPSFLIHFLLISRRFPGSRFSTDRPVAHPPLSLPSTSQTQLGNAFLGSNLFVLIVFS